MSIDQGDLDAFGEALREWGARPPATPARRAAQRVLDSLPASRPGAPWWRPALAAAVLLLAVLTVWMVVDRGVPPVPGPVTTAVTTPPLDDNVVLWWIEPDTPVYFVFPLANGNEGGTS